MMSKNTFYIQAHWDEDAGVFYSESDIEGLHIEAPTLEEFEAIMKEVATDLILANHISGPEIVNSPLRDWIPTIFLSAPGKEADHGKTSPAMA